MYIFVYILTLDYIPQVNELHRLYQIQKILMKNIRSSNSSSQRKVDYSEQRPISTVDYDDIINKISIRDESDGGDIDEGDIELTLGPTSYGRRRRRGENKPSDCGPSFSSSSTESSSRLNRTQTTGNNNNNTNNNSKKVENVEEELRLNKHPPWLFQVLSLNMT